jgi:predicted kinase/predicted N-acetyltransferase YhbS
MTMPTLFLMCGLPGAGKTTVAKRLEHERRALRLTTDEWMRALFGPDLEAEGREAVEAIQWQVAARALELGLDVVLDFGVWTRAERDRYRAQAAALGARVELVLVDAPLDERWRRIEARNAAQAPGEYRITREKLAHWTTWYDRPHAAALAASADEVKIELARPGDIPALPAIERAAATLFASWDFPMDLPQDHTPHEEFAQAQREGRLFVARTASGEVVGFALGDLVGGVPHLEEVDVLPELGQRGIGRRLVEAVCDWARAGGHARLTLTTFREVPWNEPFYARCGFRALAESELSDALRSVVEDEAARGLDPALRVVMGLELRGERRG